LTTNSHRKKPEEKDTIPSRSDRLCAHIIKQMAQFIINPKPFLADLVGKVIKVRLKWGMEYQGKLESSDAYMNLQLLNTEEFIDGELAGFLGEVLVRCNNVLYIKASENQEDTTTSGDGEGGNTTSQDAAMRD